VGRRARPLDTVSRVYWPLIGGLIALVLFTVFLGWVMDVSRRDDGDRH
jgi:hypothetical protein